MSEKCFVDFMGSSRIDRIRCSFETHRGKVIRIRVAQYETRIEGKWMPVVRYNTSHGIFHRNMYFFGSKRQIKKFLSNPNLNKALSDAIKDLRDNLPTYKRNFLVESYADKEDSQT